jgi:cystine transport system substrate-binding protein
MEIGESYGAQVSPAETLADTMTLVLTGQVDATINASTSVLDYMKTTGEQNLKTAAVLDEPTSYAIPLPKKPENEALVEAINKAIAEMREDGTLAAISMKYFNEDLTSN